MRRLLSLPSVMTLGTRRTAVRISRSHWSPKARVAERSSVFQFELCGESVEELVEEVFYAACTEFGAGDVEWREVLQFGVGFGHPIAGLISVVPDERRLSEDAGQALGSFAFIDGKAVVAALPGSLRDNLEFVGAGDFVVVVKAGGEAFEREFGEACGDG